LGKDTKRNESIMNELHPCSDSPVAEKSSLPSTSLRERWDAPLTVALGLIAASAISIYAWQNKPLLG